MIAGVWLGRRGGQALAVGIAILGATVIWFGVLGPPR